MSTSGSCWYWWSWYHHSQRVDFSRFRRHLSDKANAFSPVSPWGKLSLLFLLLGIAHMRQCDGRAVCVYPPILSDGLFNFVVMQSLFYIPFFLIGRWPLFIRSLNRCLRRPPWCAFGAAIAFAAYLLNQRYGSGDAWMYETESVITMLLGLWMVNVVFALGHRLNFKSAASPISSMLRCLSIWCTTPDAVLRGLYHTAYRLQHAGLLYRAGLCD